MTFSIKVLRYRRPRGAAHPSGKPHTVRLYMEYTQERGISNLRSCCCVSALASMSALAAAQTTWMLIKPPLNQTALREVINFPSSSSNSGGCPLGFCHRFRLQLLLLMSQPFFVSLFQISDSAFLEVWKLFQKYFLALLFPCSRAYCPILA